MPLLATSGYFHFPQPAPQQDNTVQYASILLDSATEYVANIVPVALTGTIDSIGFRTGAVTSAGSGDIRVETVTDQGPSGTLVSAGATTVVSLAAANTWVTVTLRTGATVYVGSAIAIKIQMTSSTGAIGNLNISRFNGAYFDGATYGYRAQFQGTTSSNGAQLLPMGLAYADGTYPSYTYISPIEAISTNTISSTTSPDELGAAFSLPWPVNCRGIWFHADLKAGGSTRAILYDSDGSTILATHDVDLHSRLVTSDTLYQIPLAAAVTLVAASTYRLTIIPMTTTAIDFPTAVGSAAAVMSNMPFGARFYRTSRANSGSWTEDTRERPLCGLILDGVDDGTSVGGTTVVSGGAWGF